MYVQVIKYYAWERPFMSKVAGIRKKEVSCIINYHYLLSGLNVTFTVVCSFLSLLHTFHPDFINLLLPPQITLQVPLLVTLATFTAYVHLDPVNNKVTIEKVFACIATFNLLREPLFLFPIFLLKMVQLGVSLRRLSAFLVAEEVQIPEEEQVYKEVQVNSTNEHCEGNAVLTLSKATFHWDQSEEAVLREVELVVGRGELVGVVGRVGAGKSSLLLAMMGELGGSGVSRSARCGGVAYAGQQPWIQNLSIKENILFGRLKDTARYLEVVECCALLPDLALLPAGDNTIIGK